MRFFFFFFFVVFNVFSQKNSYIKGYTIMTSGLPQKIELIKKEKNSFVGYFITTLDRKRIFRKEVEYIDTLLINSEKAKEIFLKLEELKIDSLYNCNYKNDCIIGLDGDTTAIEIYEKDSVKSLPFWELRPNRSLKRKITKNRKIAQEIINYIDDRFNLKNQFSQLTKRLPKGRYSYWTSYFIVSFRK